jgi:hypothetical protein
MGTSDILLGIVAGGVVMTVLYLIAEFMSWQTIKNSEIQAGVLLREIYRKLHASGAKLHARTKPYLERRKANRPQ